MACGESSRWRASPEISLEVSAESPESARQFFTIAAASTGTL